MTEINQKPDTTEYGQYNREAHEASGRARLARTKYAWEEAAALHAKCVKHAPNDTERQEHFDMMESALTEAGHR